MALQITNPVRTVVNQVYEKLFVEPREQRAHWEFVDEFFGSRQEYSQLIKEFENGPSVSIRNEALDQYRRLTGENALYGVELSALADYYALIRKQQPETLVETGVCNGLSTLAILLALHENQSGTLYSIDYPYRADESLEKFRSETFDGYGGAAIPSDKTPGWIIPETLHDRWNLTIGKSQRELPKLLTDLGHCDMFFHDSEHSHPCMMFEYEIAYEWLSDDGILLSDDIHWNDAFGIFADLRGTSGKLSRNHGYIRK